MRKLFYILISVLLYNQLGCKTDNIVNKKYLDDSKQLSITISKIDDESIKGFHCFVFMKGRRVDCCEDEKTNSIKLEKQNEYYKGTLTSCYNEERYRIEIEFIGKDIYLKFIDDDYPFIDKNILLIQEKYTE